MKFHARLCPEGTVNTPMHTHIANEIIINKKGNGILTVLDKDYPIESNTVAVIPSNVPHRDFSSTPRVSGTISFPPVEGQQITNMVFFYDHNQMFEKLFDLVLAASKNKSPYNQLFYRTIGDAIYTLLQSRGACSSKTVNIMVDGIDQLIRQNFADPNFDLTLEIKKTGYNACYFRRLYRETFGRPPLMQLTYTRLEYAKSLMRLYHNSMSIKEISAKSGFQDAYYFSRMFKQHENKSPTDYLAECKSVVLPK